MKTFPVILNDARPAGQSPVLHCLLRNKEDISKPVEVLIYDIIGKDWKGDGFDAKDFVAQLKDIDENRELHVRVNSRGGVVDEGIAIYNRLREWKGKTVAIVDGAAASIASVLINGADEVHMPESAEILIHEAHAYIEAAVNSDDLDRLRDELKPRLESASNRIASIYAARTGKSAEEMRAYMRKTTVFNGREAKAIGLCDVLTDASPLYNFTPEDIYRFRVETERKPPTKPPAANSGEDTMNKEQLIAAIKKFGGTVADNATLETLTNHLNALIEAKTNPTTETIQALAKIDAAAAKALEKKEPGQTNPAADPTVVALQQTVNLLLEQNKTEKKSRITAEIDRLIENNQVPGAMREKAIARALADETILDEYRALPSQLPGAAPMNVNVEELGNDPRDITKAIKNCNAPMASWQRGNEVKMRDISNASLKRAMIINSGLSKLVPLWNTNTVDTALKRDVILQVVIKDFARKTLPLRAFSTVFENVPLEGTNKVQVPFYDLDAGASTSFVEGTGYTTIGNTTTDNREITVGTGASDGDRLYQALSFSSEEVARQPYLKTLELAQLKADKLASDFVADVLSVITNANFGAAAKTTPASAFDSDDIADLVLSCKLWPYMGRSLIIDTAYHVNLLKDSSFKSALNAASDEAIKNGKLFPNVYGFNYMENPTIPSNSENLVGFAVFQSAILVATAPVPPVQEVRNAGTTYSVITDPASGVAFEYRSFGNNVTDAATHVIEVSYGWAKGNGNALKRIVSA